MKQTHHLSGFGLYKILIVVMLIGVVAVVAVPKIKELDARSQAAKENATIIVTTYEAAAAAGAFQSKLSTKEEIFDAIQAGVNGVGLFSDMVFKINTLDPRARAEAEAFLEYDPEAGLLRVKPNAVLP